MARCAGADSERSSRPSAARAPIDALVLVQDASSSLAPAQGAQLVAAKVSSGPGTDLLGVDPVSHGLRVIAPAPAPGAGHAAGGCRRGTEDGDRSGIFGAAGHPSHAAQHRRARRSRGSAARGAGRKMPTPWRWP
jgi:hypothetical protein